MTKKWTIEFDLPDGRTAIYDEAKSGVDRFELEDTARLNRQSPLLFSLPKKSLTKMRDYGVIPSNILIPLVNSAVRSSIESLVDEQEIQFIPAVINSGGHVVDGPHFLLKPLKKVDVIDQEKSEPIMIKIPGFPDAKLAIRKWF